MHKAISAAILALAISGAALATVGTADAAGVSVNVGGAGIAFGYQDGYWDHGHHWHNWRNQNEMRTYKTASGGQFHDWKHTRDKNQGWMQ